MQPCWLVVDCIVRVVGRFAWVDGTRKATFLHFPLSTFFITFYHFSNRDFFHKTLSRNKSSRDFFGVNLSILLCSTHACSLSTTLISKRLLQTRQMTIFSSKSQRMWLQSIRTSTCSGHPAMCICGDLWTSNHRVRQRSTVACTSASLMGIGVNPFAAFTHCSSSWPISTQLADCSQIDRSKNRHDFDVSQSLSSPTPHHLSPSITTEYSSICLPFHSVTSTSPTIRTSP